MSNRVKTIELFLALGFATAVGSQAVTANTSGVDETISEPTIDLLLLAEGGEGGESAEGGEGGESAEGGEGGESAEGGEGGESAEGGEGGEGGEGAVSTGDPEVDYMTVLGLMKSQLNTTKELVASGNYEQAEPHIKQSVEELYGSVATALPEKGVEDFKPTLTQLHDLIKTAPESPEVVTLLDESTTSVDSAIAAVPEEQASSPEFVLDVMVEMLKNAATKYQAAIANNSFARIVEYQDAKGFIDYADELYQTVADANSEANPEGHKNISDSLAKLKTSVPSVEPPEAPVLEPAQVQGLVSQIEFSK